MVDIPGCYSLMAHSTEEEVARDFICFENPDAVVVVCDATCLERNMNLVMQILEASSRVVVCVNLMDEAEKKKIHIDLSMLESRLGVPVIGTAARSNKGLEQIFDALEKVLKREQNDEQSVRPVIYDEDTQELIELLVPAVSRHCQGKVNVRWLCARLLDADSSLFESIHKYMGVDIIKKEGIPDAVFEVRDRMEKKGITKKQLSDGIAASFSSAAEKVCDGVVTYGNRSYAKRDRQLDLLFTSKLTGFPIMFLVLLGIFWLTITGANYPSQLLNTALFGVESYLVDFFIWIGAPKFLYEMLVYGVYRVLAWVVSVMLPPMAIFFPLFTLLEDFGYLPRVAFNLDHCFKRCRACGKQALTMCMGGISL